MYPLLETIKVENGKLVNLPCHQERMDRARCEFLGLKDSLLLETILDVPEYAEKGVYKCRVSYGASIGIIEFIHHIPKRVKTLKLIIDNEIDYTYKYSDRSHLQRLLSLKGNCDDILIAKNGLISDTSFSNIVFSNGKNWFTPDQPLLKGTKRGTLLKTGKIKSKRIKTDDIQKYSTFALINALMDLDDGSNYPIENIVRDS